MWHVRWERSLMPLPCGWYGEVLTALMPNCCRSSVHRCPTNSGPLSDSTAWGGPEVSNDPVEEDLCHCGGRVVLGGNHDAVPREAVDKHHQEPFPLILWQGPYDVDEHHLPWTLRPDVPLRGRLLLIILSKLAPLALCNELLAPFPCSGAWVVLP